LPLFAPGILLIILLNKNFSLKQNISLAAIAITAFALPQLLISFWIENRGAALRFSNEETYKIIINAYLNIFNQLPTWWMRVKIVPDTLFYCFFHSNFFVLPILFLITWIIGRFFYKFKLNLIERCLLLSIICLFLFNNMAPPYEGEWQMWGDWMARVYQSVFIVYLMYIIRLSAFIYSHRKLNIGFTAIIVLACLFNIVVNTGGLYASPLTSYVYSCFYKHGRTTSYSRNIKFYGARPLGFPVHYETETK
jgi:hypothetical protein